MARNMFAALMLLLGAAAAAQAQDYCASAGAYHLSCYAASVTSDDAQAAKAQCFSEWANPKCNSVIVPAPANLGGCGTPVLYKFATEECREAYQAQEKTNAACTSYATAGLGDAANRMAATGATDYVCA